MEQEVIRKAHAAGLFEDKTAEYVAKMFHSALVHSEKSSTMRLRTKLNREGPKRCRFFEHPIKDLSLIHI